MTGFDYWIAQEVGHQLGGYTVTCVLEDRVFVKCPDGKERVIRANAKGTKEVDEQPKETA